MGQFKHGHATRRSGSVRTTPEYRAYFAMKNRCLNKSQARYADYGGRGITICERWLNGENGLSGFECFLLDVGAKPSLSHSIERRDNDDGYRPGNVRWATREEQARNTRATRIVDVCGYEVSLVEAVSRWGAASYQTVMMRLHRGWRPDDAIFTPAGRKPGPSSIVGPWKGAPL